jgi:ribosomal protein S18 acetylase RimI-like enzyme
MLQKNTRRKFNTINIIRDICPGFPLQNNRKSNPDMFKVRKALPGDFSGIFALYKKVSVLPLGIARNTEEITGEYIQHFMQNADEKGIELVIDNPENKNEIIAEIHCYKWGIEKFDHVLTELTIAVLPAFHGQGIGKLIFTHLLNLVETQRPDILRVELVAQESNRKAIDFYKKSGFSPEGRFENRIKLNPTGFEADIPMAWFNKNFGKNK